MTRFVPAGFLIWVSIVLAGPAIAHPGHGQGGGSFSLNHHLGEPTHLVESLLLLAGVVAAVWLARQRGRSFDRLRP